MTRHRTATVVTAAALVALLVAPGGAAPAAAAAPAANGPIAFDAWLTLGSGFHNIYTIAPDGTGLTQLTDYPVGGDYSSPGAPSFSTDGSRIAFQYGAGPVAVMNADGSDQHVVANKGEPTVPTWSPDGRVAFAAFTGCGEFDPDCQYDLWAVAADGSGLAPLFSIGQAAYSIAWSPDGAQIALGVAYDVAQPLSGIRLVAPDGATVGFLDVGAQVGTANTPVSLAWSPDGSRVAFVLEGDIWTIGVDGGSLTRVTTNADPVHGIGWTGVDWSPDGTRLAASWFGSDASSRLVTMDPDGTDETILLSGEYFGGVSWAPAAGAQFDFTGFFAPVDNGKLNVAKAGSAVPVKFSLGGDQGLDIFAPGYPKAVAVACEAGEVLDTIETYAAGASGLQYDEATGLYTYVWKTQKAWKGCYEFQMKLADGSVHIADFKFK